MKKVLFLIVILSVFTCDFTFAQDKNESFKYVNAENLMIINKGFDDTELAFSRLPKDIKSVSREAVWGHGLCSSGIAVRFASNAKKIKARWTLLNNSSMNHMAPTGICGLDIYQLDDKDGWHFAGTARPEGKESESNFGSYPGEWREYMVYLPLYDGVTSLEIGVDQDSEITMPRKNVLVRGQKPVLFYGTSITQGGCASRPGMVYTSILSRKWQKECVNLGFSGNARMDKSMAEAIARVDAEVFVIDCLPNCNPQVIRDSAEVFLRIVADAHPETPIYMVENVVNMSEYVNPDTAQYYSQKHVLWKELYKRLRKEGYKNLKYIPRDKLSGNDGEETVDNVHRTDLGFLRMAEGFAKYIKF